MVTVGKRSVVLAVAGVLTVYGQVHAENKAEALETGSVEVVGTTPLPGIGTPISEVPSNVQTGSAKDIAVQRNLDVSEFIDANLGSVSTSNSVANPYQADVSFRGFTASPLLGTPQGMSVFLDGVRVNEPFGDVVNWDIIPSNAIASINLIPGSNPLFGLNTLGGALSVHTKSGAEFPGYSATVYGGSWGRRAVEFEVGGANQDKSLDYFVAGNTFREDGWRDHSTSEVNQLFAKVGWQNESSDLDLSIMAADTNLEGTQALPVSMLSNREQAYSWPDSIGNNLAMMNLKGSHFLSDDKLIAGNVYYRRNRITGFNSNLNGDYDPTNLNGNGVNTIEASNIATTADQDGFGGALQLTLLGDLAGHKNQFTVGASADMGRTNFQSDTSEATVVGSQTVTIQPASALGSVRLHARNDYYGLYGTDTYSFNEQWHLTLSGRYNVAKVKLSGYNIDDASVSHDLSGRHFYSRFNPAVGLNFNPSKALNLYGGYNEGMRAATPVELSCADRLNPCALPNSFASDPHLKAVVSRTWEGGARGEFLAGFNWNVGLYRTENENDIQFISDPTNPTTFGFFDNVGKTLRQGLELGLSGKLNKLTLSANYGYVDATFETPFSVNTLNGSATVNEGSEIPGIPHHTMKLRVAYEITPAWTVGSNIVMASNQYARGDETNQMGFGKVPGYGVVHLDTHYQVDEHWNVFAKVNNVFDKDYSTFGVLGTNEFTGANNSFNTDITQWQNEKFVSPSAPRAAWVGVTYEFGKAKSSTVDRD